MHEVATRSIACICQIEELIDSTMDLYPLESLLLHPGHIGIPLVLIPIMDPPLSRLYPFADEAPDHYWSIKMRPLD
jgi:hypothetical protein